MEFWNFEFEVEGEFPIFVAIEQDRPFMQARAEAMAKAVEVFEVPANEIHYGGVYNDLDAEILGYDTF